MELYKRICSRSGYLSGEELIGELDVSRSQFYRWRQGFAERKRRDVKSFPVEIVESAVGVIRRYPHFSGVKGQCYMGYHGLGYISQPFYRKLKKIVKHLLFQEVDRRRILPGKISYTHQRADKVGQIWGADSMELRVYGEKFYSGIVIDVYDVYTLGVSLRSRIDKELVEFPVDEALAENGGVGPEYFLLSDNGSQYVSTGHGDFLDKREIVHKRIPSCRPQYNGSVECGIKEFKNVFYNVWAERESEGVVREKRLEDRVRLAVKETKKRMNFEIPRPRLGGVCPGDVHRGIDGEKVVANREYVRRELEKSSEDRMWNVKDWSFVKGSLFKGGMSDLELMTKFCFFLRRPLRKLADLSVGGVG
jgi:transposase InsO family protein